MSLLDDPPLDLAEARARLAELRALIRRRAALGAALAMLGALLVVLGSERLGVPLLIGAGAAALLVSFGRDDRRRLLVRLVAQDDAGAIEEVRLAAERLTSPGERRRLAGGLRQAAEAATPRKAEFNLVDPVRARRFGGRLRGLAAAIGDEGVPFGAAGAALCRRLLSEARISPLYNPALADSELDRAIALIERSLRPG